MTTIAFKDGILASDSRYSHESFGITRGPKLFRKTVGKREFLLGIAGDAHAAMLFVDWYGTSNADLYKILTEMADDNFAVLVWDGKHLSEANRYCRPIEVDEPYYAIGSGAGHAMTAMDCGKNAVQAVRFAARRDHYTGGRIVSMSLTKGKAAP
jgi:ATP-dependent protease HslVU (ClpYQ) peptidase subunit